MALLTVWYTCASYNVHFCSQFQQEYQTFFRDSFRVSDYLSEENAGLKDLLQVCDGIQVSILACLAYLCCWSLYMDVCKA